MDPLWNVGPQRMLRVGGRAVAPHGFSTRTALVFLSLAMRRNRVGPILRAAEVSGLLSGRHVDLRMQAEVPMEARCARLEGTNDERDVGQHGHG